MYIVLLIVIELIYVRGITKNGFIQRPRVLCSTTQTGREDFCNSDKHCGKADHDPKCSDLDGELQFLQVDFSVFSVTSGTGKANKLETDQKQYLFDGNYEAGASDHQQLMIRLSNELNPPFPVYVSMIALYGNREKMSRVKVSYFKNGIKKSVTVPENGLLFADLKKPLLLDHFNITIETPRRTESGTAKDEPTQHESTDNINQPNSNNQVITEIEVYRPALLGDRTYFSPASISSNWSTVREYCHSKGATLASNYKQYKVDDNGKDKWLGFVELNKGDTDEMVWDNGDYNQFTGTFEDFDTSKNAKVARTVTSTASWQSASNALRPLCVRSDAVYYLTKEAGTSADVLKHCAKDGAGGIPVSPNSDHERAAIISTFPGQTLRVAGCRDVQAIENFYEREKPLDCRSNGLVLTPDNVLEIEGSQQMLKGVCKKFTGHGKRIEIAELATGFPDQEKLVDGDIMSAFGGRDNCSTLTAVKALFRRVEKVHKLRIMMSFNLTTAKDYLYVTILCNNTVGITSTTSAHMLVPLSKSHRYQYHTKVFPEGMMCDEVSLSWKCGVDIAEIQFLEPASTEPYITSDSLHLDLTQGLVLKCTVEARAVVLKWYYRQNNTALAEPADVTETLSGLYTEEANITSSITIHDRVNVGLYSCKDTLSGNTSNEVKVDLQMHCLVTSTLTDIPNGSLLSTDNVPVYSFLNYTCDEGYRKTSSVECAIGGVFSADVSKFCIATAIYELDKLNADIENMKAPKISGKLYDILKDYGIAHLEEGHIRNITGLLENVTNESYSDHKVLQTVVQSIGILLTLPSHVKELMDLVDDIGRNVVLEGGRSLKLAGDRVAVMVADVKLKEPENVTFAVFSNNSYAAEDLNMYTWSVDTQASAGSVQLPKEWHSRSKRLWFTVLENNTYPVPNDSVIGSIILGANVDKLNNSKGGKAVLVLEKLQPGVNARCVYWDAKGSVWSSEGVEVISDTLTHVTCRTEHLTSFAVLMTPDDSFIPDYHKYVLDYVSTGGSILSCICLLITIVCLSAFKKIRQPTSTKIHIHLSVALFCSIFIFLCFIDKVEAPTFCVTGAILLHYFLLVSMALMMCEAVHMYLSFVVIFTNRNHVLIMAGFAWGIPLLIVFFCLAQGLQNYRNPEICWLTSEAMYYWFAPLVIIIALVNSVFFILILKAVASALPRKQRIQGTAEMRSCVAIMTLLGCTWTFGFFTLFTKIVLFQYLFAISNSLQGFFIFFFYCGTRPDVINAWKKVLRIGGARFETSTSTFRSNPASSKTTTCPTPRAVKERPAPSFTVPSRRPSMQSRVNSSKTGEVMSVVDCEEDNF